MAAPSTVHGLPLYAELVFSVLAVAVVIASTRYAYSRRDGQVEITWMARFNYSTKYSW